MSGLPASIRAERRGVRLRRRAGRGGLYDGCAVHAALGGDGDLAQALGALAVSDLLLPLQPGGEPGSGRDEQVVDHGGDDHEGQRGIDKAAVGEMALVDRERQLAEVRLPADGADERRDQVFDQRLDHRVESDADDYRDGKLDEIAAEPELPEAAHAASPPDGTGTEDPVDSTTDHLATRDVINETRPAVDVSRMAGADSG